VALLRDGTVAAVGTHTHLLDTEPDYADLMGEHSWAESDR
jgi:hypothetical protein